MKLCTVVDVRAAKVEIYVSDAYYKLSEMLHFNMKCSKMNIQIPTQTALVDLDCEHK